ncbi:MAG: DsbA family protein [Myxococcota bacterium]|nr:DsbA family protein [Myxococcota bacterium]
MDQSAEFVFSLRSPYSWMAARWVLPQLPADLPVRWRPFYPRPSFPNFGAPVEGKFQYLVRDVVRLARHHGARVEFPSIDDPDWSIPHTAFLEAEARGRGPELARALGDARWTRGENLAEPAVLERAAREVGLDAEAVVAAAHDETRRRALDEQVERDYHERGIFGVPTLILPRGSRYWGHDRIEWAIRSGHLAGRI